MKLLSRNFCLSFLLIPALIIFCGSGCPNEEREANEALLQAIEAQDFKTIQKLMAEGTDVGGVSSEGETPLTLAIKLTKAGQKGKIPCILAEQKTSEIAQKNREGKAPLGLALERELTNVVTCLLEHGAAKHNISMDGISPLLWTLTKKEIELAKLLMSHSIDPNFRGDKGLESGNYPLHEAVLLGNDEIIELLLKLKPQVD